MHKEKRVNAREDIVNSAKFHNLERGKEGKKKVISNTHRSLLRRFHSHHIDRIRGNDWRPRRKKNWCRFQSFSCVHFPFQIEMSTNNFSYKHVFRNREAYWKRVKNQLQQQELKAKSINFRNKLLSDQKTLNYKLEYDRLRGVLAHSVLNQQTKVNINKRTDDLKKFIFV